MCGIVDVGCQIKDGAASVMETLATAVAQAVGDLVALSFTWWVTTPSIDPNTEGVQQLQRFTLPVAIFILLISMFIQCGRLIISAKKDPLIDMVALLGRYVLVSSGGLLALAGAVQAGDALAVNMIEQGLDAYGARVGQLFGAAAITNPFATIFVGSVTLGLSVVQWVLGFVRLAGIAILAVFLPVAAAGPTRWLTRILLWSAALVAYKYEAATIYTIGFSLLGSGQDFSTLMVAMMTMVSAVLALPATLRFFSWSEAAVTSGSGIGTALAAGASGAVALAGVAGRNPAVQSAQALESAWPSSGSSPSGSTSSGPISSGSNPSGAQSEGTGASPPPGEGAPGAPAAGGAPSTAAATAGTAGGPVGAAVVAGVNVASAAVGGMTDAATSPPPPPVPSPVPRTDPGDRP